jgi:putative ABC transport system permease protein
MDSLLQDLRYAVRTLARKPVFTAVAVLALALGTGANTLIFSVVNAVLLRPLPYADADRLYVLRTVSPDRSVDDGQLSRLDFTDIAEQTRSLSVAAVGFANFDLTNAAEPQQLVAGPVSHDFFATLGVAPILGRTFTPDEIRADAPVALLAEELWRAQFASDPGIVGRPVTLDGKPVTVVGVMPRVAFRYFEPSVWVPLGLGINAGPDARRNQRDLNVVARLREGASAETARDELAVIARRLAAAHPKENGGWELELVALAEHELGGARPALLVLLGAVGFVLLIACANVANMLLARAVQRRREMAVRISLGATRARIVRQLLTESVLLAAASAGTGFLLAVWLLPLVTAIAPLSDDQRSTVAIDAPVLAFTVTLALLTGLLFGLAPALGASRADVQASLKADGSAGATARVGWRMRAALVVTEVALASVLLTGAGLLLKSFSTLLRVDRGYDPQSVVTTGVVLPSNVYGTGAQKREFFRATLERLSAMPEVEHAGAVNFPPGFGGGVPVEALVAGRDERDQPARRQVIWRVATPGFFPALRIRFVRGRNFGAEDVSDGVPVAIVNRTFVQRFFPGEDPIGREVRLFGRQAPAVRVVGVIADVRNAGRNADATPDIFLPYAQNSWGYMNFVVRGRAGAEAAPLIAAIRRAVHEVDPARPTFTEQPLARHVDLDVAEPRFGATLLAAFAALALVLSCVGIFGVMAYAVSARTRELGIRVALGAERRDVLRLVLGPGMALVGAGVVGGLLGAIALSRVIASLLYSVRPVDPAVLAAVVGVLAVTGLVACYVPARRALRVTPTEALRAE